MGKPTGRLPPGPDVPPAGHLGRLQPGAHPRGRVDRTVRGVRDALARLEADGAICRGRRGRATRVGNVCASYLLPRLALVLFKVARAARKVVTTPSERVRSGIRNQTQRSETGRSRDHSAARPEPARRTGQLRSLADLLDDLRQRLHLDDDHEERPGGSDQPGMTTGQQVRNPHRVTGSGQRTAEG